MAGEWPGVEAGVEFVDATAAASVPSQGHAGAGGGESESGSGGGGRMGLGWAWHAERSVLGVETVLRLAYEVAADDGGGGDGSRGGIGGGDGALGSRAPQARRGTHLIAAGK
jgi:hypothetical protein